ncbi:MAG: alpha/beta hydrolase [Cyanobacteria bacterium RM1_2_2]|nr:alpha/beta hydrolase [Cyanobacteria bacterium RM1_2_2]
MSDSPYFLALRSPRTPQPNAPLFIYLPGGDGTGQLLYRQLEGLEKTFDIRCLEIPPDDLANWEQLTEQVVGLVKTELKRSPRSAVYLCGESFGGCLALKVINHSPHLFDYLTLVNPASAFNRPSWLYWLSFLARPVPNLIYQNFWLWFLPILAALGRIEADDRRALLTAVQGMTQETSVWRVALLREFQFSDVDLRQIKQPTLVIASGRDSILPSVDEAKRLTKLIPNSKTHVLPDSGHACLLEADVYLHDILQSVNLLPERQPVTGG